MIDTLALARSRRPDAPDHRLDTMTRLLGLDPDGPHRALADSRRVMGLWLALAGDDWPREPDPLALYRVVAARGLDGGKLLDSHAAGTLAADLGAAPADVNPAADAVAAWRRRVFGDLQPSPPRAWSPAAAVRQAERKTKRGQCVRNSCISASASVGSSPPSVSSIHSTGRGSASAFPSGLQALWP